MEKLKIDKTELFKITSAICFLSSIVFPFLQPRFGSPYLFSVIFWFIFLVIFINSIVLIILFKNKFSKNELYFSKDGLKLGANELYEWKQIQVKNWQTSGILIKSSHAALLLKDNSFNLSFSSLTNKSLLPLIKKYTPSDHDLYRAAREYAANKKLKF